MRHQVSSVENPKYGWNGLPCYVCEDVLGSSFSLGLRQPNALVGLLNSCFWAVSTRGQHYVGFIFPSVFNRPFEMISRGHGLFVSIQIPLRSFSLRGMEDFLQTFIGAKNSYFIVCIIYQSSEHQSFMRIFWRLEKGLWGRRYFSMCEGIGFLQPEGTCFRFVSSENHKLLVLDTPRLGINSLVDTIFYGLQFYWCISEQSSWTWEG